MNISSPIMTLEGGLTVGFLGLLLFLRQKGGRGDDILWGLVWTTRVLASLNGARHLSQFSPEFGAYMGLQALSGLSLMLIVMRSEVRVWRERFFRRILVQLGDTGGGGRRDAPMEPADAKRST